MNNQTVPEVFVLIRFVNGDQLTRRFHACEKAWQWEIKTRHEYANRRNKETRVDVLLSLYAGCTTTGKSYGGILHGNDRYENNLPSYIRQEERRQAKAHSEAEIEDILNKFAA
jgi:hypothetical protein